MAAPSFRPRQGPPHARVTQVRGPASTRAPVSRGGAESSARLKIGREPPQPPPTPSVLTRVEGGSGAGGGGRASALGAPAAWGGQVLYGVEKRKGARGLGRVGGGAEAERAGERGEAAGLGEAGGWSF